MHAKAPAKDARHLAQRPPAAARQEPPDFTLREAQYLKYLVASKTRVRLKLRDNEQVEGVLEYYDASFIRLTRAGDANVFVYKSEIKYLEELP